MTDKPNSLYAAWFDALPQAFRALMPGAGSGAKSTVDASVENAPLPFPADQVGKALGLLDGILTQLYQSYLPLLADGGMTAQRIEALADSATQAFNTLLATFATQASALSSLTDWTRLAQSAEPWSGLLGGLGATQGKPSGAGLLQLGIERTFGGLGEALGLGPVRELEQALREMLAATASKQRAQAEYLALVAQALSKGTRGLLHELSAMGARGERVESLLAFIRLWAKAVDDPMHDTMQDPRGLEVTSKVLRAASEHRQHLQKAVEIASEALHVPTRADMEEAYREIQELKRKLRRLEKRLQMVEQNKSTVAKEQPT